MRRQVFERDARPLELLNESGVAHQGGHDHNIGMTIRFEQAVDQPATKDVAGRHAARDRDEYVHAVFNEAMCSNSYGSDTRPSSSSASVSTPFPWPVTAKRGPA